MKSTLTGDKLFHPRRNRGLTIECSMKQPDDCIRIFCYLVLPDPNCDICFLGYHICDACTTWFQFGVECSYNFWLFTIPPNVCRTGWLLIQAMEGISSQDNLWPRLPWWHDVIMRANCNFHIFLQLDSFEGLNAESIKIWRTSKSFGWKLARKWACIQLMSEYVRWILIFVYIIYNHINMYHNVSAIQI